MILTLQDSCVHQAFYQFVTGLHWTEGRHGHGVCVSQRCLILNPKCDVLMSLHRVIVDQVQSGHKSFPPAGLQRDSNDGCFSTVCKTVNPFGNLQKFRLMFEVLEQ